LTVAPTDRREGQGVDERHFHDRFYDADADRIFSSPLYRRLMDAHVEFLAAVMAGAENARVLSIGCGDGRREIAMAQFVGEIVGIDLSPVAIEMACARALRAGAHNVAFRVLDAADVEKTFDGCFDAVWCAGVLHHLTDAGIDEVLRGTRSVLKDGGRFVSMDPNAGRAVNLFKPLFRRRFDACHSADERELRPAVMARRVKKAGFADVGVRFTDAFISPLAWLYPHIGEAPAHVLALIDRLLVSAPILARLSSGFAVVGRKVR
jgi:SAM-dependent methyltransferase